MGESADRWTRSIDGLRSRGHTPAALAGAELLELLRSEWEDRVVARTSHFDLLFTPIGQKYPWRSQVEVAVDGEVFEFRLKRDSGTTLVTADRCRRELAPEVLRAFLYQLEAEI